MTIHTEPLEPQLAESSEGSESNPASPLDDDEMLSRGEKPVVLLVLPMVKLKQIPTLKLYHIQCSTCTCVTEWW